jgi:predicted permease
MRHILRALLPRADRDDLLFEMDELHRSRRSRTGPLRAGLWYGMAVLGFAARLGVERVATALRDIGSDLRYGGRVLRRRPGYVLTSALTVAVGAGGLTAVFTAADHLLLRPVAGIDDPASLVTLRLGSSDGPRPSWPVSHPEFEELRDGLAGIGAVGARAVRDVNMGAPEGGSALRGRVAIVSTDWFAILGAPLEAGRWPTPAADPALAGQGEIVLSERTARTLAPSAVEAIGRTIDVDGAPHRVVGVAGGGFEGIETAVPVAGWLGASAFVALDPEATAIGIFASRHSGRWETLVVRSDPGVTAEDVGTRAERVRQAAVEAELLGTTTMVSHFLYRADPGVGLDPGLRGSVRRTVLYLGSAAGLLLLLCAANVGNLALARVEARRGQLSLRRALGAGRWRLLRQQLAESGLLAGIGGLGALGVAGLGVTVLSRVRLDEYGAALDGLELAGRGVALALALSVGTTWTAALLAGRVSVAVSSSEVLGSRFGSTPPARARRARALLAGAQVALSTVLVVGSGLLGRTVVNLRTLDLGFDPADTWAWSVDPERRDRSSEEGLRLLRDLVDEVEAHAGVSHAGVVWPEPLRSSFLTSSLIRDGAAEDENRLLGAHLQIGGRFLEAMGVRFLAGGSFRESLGSIEGRPLRTGGADDSAEGPDGSQGRVILTASALPRLVPGATPAEAVGRRVRTPDGTPLRIVGVVESLRLTGPREDPPPIFIRPWSEGRQDVEVVVWARPSRGGALRPGVVARGATAAVDPSMPAWDVRSVRAQADRMAARPRVLAGLASTVSALGLLLAALGLYGLLGHAVAERRREIGIRTALGADAGEIVAGVAGRGLAIALAGLVPGLLLAIALTRSLESVLYGVRPLDPVAWFAGIGIILLVAALATAAPARRATLVPVVEVLRSDG